MEAATENKRRRGRPPAFKAWEVAMWNDTRDHRAAVNMCYLLSGLGYIEDNKLDGDRAKTKAIFSTNGKNFRYQGPLEQLGRAIDSGLFEPEEIDELDDLLLESIREGMKSKEIEARLRNVRKLWKEKTAQ